MTANLISFMKKKNATCNTEEGLGQAKHEGETLWVKTGSWKCVWNQVHTITQHGCIHFQTLGTFTALPSRMYQIHQCGLY